MMRTILSVTLPGFVLGGAAMALANRRIAVAIARARWLKLAVFFLIVHSVLWLAAMGREWVFGFVLVVLTVGAGEIRNAWSRMAAPRPARVWLMFAVAAVLALVTCRRMPPEAFAFLFLVTAACDGFSQVVGQAIGRRQLAPRLSPGKTVGGLMGGLVAAAIIAVFVRNLLPARPVAAAVLGLAIGLAGLAGDLAASWVKRRADLKDFSSMLPGQGGFLDRFDSLLGALVLVGPSLATNG